MPSAHPRTRSEGSPRRSPGRASSGDTSGEIILARDEKVVALSLEGSEFLPYAREILARENAALAAPGQGDADVTGTLRFAAPEALTFDVRRDLAIFPITLVRFAMQESTPPRFGDPHRKCRAICRQSLGECGLRPAWFAKHSQHQLEP